MSEDVGSWLRYKARLFKALGDTTRLKILYFLRDGERCVCEIFPYVNLAQPTTSRHLNVLKECGILEVRRDGNKRLYSVTEPRIYDVLDVLDTSLMHSLTQKVMKQMIPLAGRAST
jgi:ArsR family transcriptional regulator